MTLDLSTSVTLPLLTMSDAAHSEGAFPFSIIHLSTVQDGIQNVDLHVFIFRNPFTSEGLGFLVEIEI
jgi:hypothetical protein